MQKRIHFLKIAFVALPLTLAACGSSSSTPAASTQATSVGSGGPGGADQTKMQECLKKQGITLPNFGGSGGAPSGPPTGGAGGSQPSLPAGVDQQKLQKALEACGGSGLGNPAGANSQAFQAYTSCLKDHGVEVPTANSSGGTPPSFDRTSSAFVEANKVCQSLLPTGAGATTTTGK